MARRRGNRPLHELKERDRRIGGKRHKRGSYWVRHRSHPPLPVWLRAGDLPKRRPPMEWFGSVAEAFRNG